MDNNELPSKIFLGGLARRIIEDCEAVEQGDDTVWIEVNKGMWDLYWDYHTTLTGDQDDG